MSETGPDPDPYAVDFAALRTLRLVHALGSFSRAAEQLGLTQSTVSYTVERLRRVFGDPLFVRQQGGIVPTGRCDEIVAEAARLVDGYAAVLEPRAFDPSDAAARVTLSCNYYERAVLLPGLVQTLRRRAPGLRLTVLTSTTLGKEQLARGDADMLIGPVRIEQGTYYRRTLWRERYVCVMAPGNPLAGRSLTAETYLAAPQAVVIYGGSWQSRYLVEIEAQGGTPYAMVQVPSPAALPELLERTDLISTVPRRLAASFGPGLHVAECPFPAPFDIDLYWTARTHHSAMHRWLRSEIADLAAGMQEI